MKSCLAVRTLLGRGKGLLWRWEESLKWGWQRPAHSSWGAGSDRLWQGLGSGCVCCAPQGWAELTRMCPRLCLSVCALGHLCVLCVLTSHGHRAHPLFLLVHRIPLQCLAPLPCAGPRPAGPQLFHLVSETRLQPRPHT